MQFIVIGLLLLLSAFFSGTEMAYVTANKIKVEIKARKKNPAAKSAFYFINNPQVLFSIVLIGNTLVNIAFASLFTIYFLKYGLSEASILVISSILLLIVGELIPKYISKELADVIVLMTAIPLRIISFILYPLVKFTSALSAIFIRSGKIKDENINYLFSKEDIEYLVKESQSAGIVNKKESDIISKVLDLGDQRVYEAMRPRTEIIGVEINSNMDDVQKIFIESNFSKLPVYEENLDNVKGVIFAYDLFKYPKYLNDIIREVIFVPETKRSFEMLNEFLSKRVSIAIVIDEFGGTAGIITIEDIMEELFGEIRDEYDVEEYICKEIKKGTFLISGKVEIDYINEKYNLNLPTGDYETLAGYIISETGKIPKQGEKFKIDNFNMLIVRSSHTKIELIRVQVLPQE